MSLPVEIIAVGNELLSGEVRDSNGHWLCLQLTGLGGEVRRLAVLPDEMGPLALALRESLARGATLVITTGGLGPTTDDLTLKALAAACGLPLREHPQARAWVAETYARLAAEGAVASAELTAPRLKMAQLPAGAEPLHNPVGAAPGVWLQRGRSAVAALPGVPAELEAIFTGALAPLLARHLGAGGFALRRGWAACTDESVLAPLLARAAGAEPGTRVKSRARRFGADVRLEVTVSAATDSAQAAEARCARAWRALERQLAEAGIALTVLPEGE